MKQYVPIIGMEIHVELKTKSKMFCACKNNPDEQTANTNICPICTGQPGTLPVPNKQAIEWTVLIGKALSCDIREVSKFDRKHYFYPDLPKGYQISQFDEPIAEHGQIVLNVVLTDNHREQANIGITRVHLEEDTAKLLHNTEETTLVDFNRSGTPLVEIVSDPNIESATEAKLYCQELQRIFRYLGVSDANMEKGHMRCEANISVQEAGSFEIVNSEIHPHANYILNNKVELKNLNSFRAIERGILYEIKRQTQMIKNNETWGQETRGWNEKKNETILQRVKENASDYRYFPEPDIPPFHPLKLAIDNSLPELPQAKRTRFHEEYGFSYSDAFMLTEYRTLANFAEQVMTELIDWLYALPEVKGSTDKIREEKKQKIARLAGGWLTSKLMGQLNERGNTIDTLKVSPENFAELVSLVYTDKINSTNAQKLLTDMLDAGTDIDPSHLMEEKGYGQVSDSNILENVVNEIIINYPKQVEIFKAGKDPIIKFLIGMAMKATEGTANPQIIENILRDKLST